MVVDARLQWLLGALREGRQTRLTITSHSNGHITLKYKLGQPSSSAADNVFTAEVTESVRQQLLSRIVVNHGHRSSDGSSHVSLSLRQPPAIAHPAAPVNNGDDGDPPDGRDRARKLGGRHPHNPAGDHGPSGGPGGGSGGDPWFTGGGDPWCPLQANARGEAPHPDTADYTLPVEAHGDPLPAMLGEVQAIDMALANVTQMMESMREATQAAASSASSSAAVAHRITLDRHMIDDISNKAEAQALTKLVRQRDALRELRRRYEHEMVPSSFVFMELLQQAMDGGDAPFRSCWDRETGEAQASYTL